MSGLLPLFAAQQLKEIEQIRSRREATCERLKRLPPNSHRRIALEERVRMLTLRALKVERELKKNG